MKYEELTDAEKACLDYYRECISKSLAIPRGMHTQIYYSGKSLYEKFNGKWKPSGEFCIRHDGRVGVLSGFGSSQQKAIASSGNVYRTREEAEADAKNLKNLRLINARIRELNAETGWVADWSDLVQSKYTVIYNYSTGRWERVTRSFCASIGIEYCSEKSAEKIVEELNLGKIEGVEVC